MKTLPAISTFVLLLGAVVVPQPARADTADANDGAPPQIMVGTNGQGEVIFKNNCVVHYDKHGRRTSSLPA